jgi:hypothetical protein
MVYKETIKIRKKEAEKMERILSIEEGHCPDYDPVAVIKTYTAKFSNGFEADIKVCNGDTPFVDPVLFNEKGIEICVGEVEDTLLGEYHFEYGEDVFVVTVEVTE